MAKPDAFPRELFVTYTISILWLACHARNSSVRHARCRLSHLPHESPPKKTSNGTPCASATERAPEKWQKAGFEWLYRLIKDPKRIKRMMKLPAFMFAVTGQRIRGK